MTIKVDPMKVAHGPRIQNGGVKVFGTLVYRFQVMAVGGVYHYR